MFDGYRDKDRRRAYLKEWRKKNKDRIQERRKLYLQKHPNIVKEWKKKNQKRCLECQRKYRKKYPEKHRNDNKKWLENHPNYHNERRRASFKIRLDRNISGSIWKALKEKKAGKHWEDLVGYTLEQLQQRLECQFKDGMSWDNYGEWHIDHKKPQSLFSFNSVEDRAFRDCWSLANLQPLEKFLNWSKGNKYKATL